MTQDEKMIWAAVFAEVLGRICEESLRARADAVILAGQEADYTIEAVRRVAQNGAKIPRGFVFKAPEL